MVGNIQGCSGTTLGIIIATAATCGTNRVLNSGLGKCVSTCYSLKDNLISAFVPIDDPAQIVVNACLLTASNGVCELEAQDTSNYTYGTQLYRGGTYAYTGSKCTEDPTTPPTIGAVTGNPQGGTGTGSGGTVGLGATDAANLAATKGATQGTQVAAEQTVSRLNDLLAGRCGGPSQPACYSDIDGSGASDQIAPTKTLTDESRDAALSSIQANQDALAPGSIPTFGGDESRWRFLIDPFVGGFVASDCSHTWDVVYPGLEQTQHFTLDICPYAPYARGFMFWSLGIWTAWSLWSTIYAQARRA